MSIIECANESGHLLSRAHLPGPDPLRKLRSRVFIGFVGSVALGLALAGWYVGGRILTAAQKPAPAMSKSKVAAPVPATPVATPMIIEPAQLLEPPAPPPIPELFLEVPGLNPIQDALLVSKLQNNGLPAQVKVDADLGTRRILIGPFSSRPTIEKAEQDLQAEGIVALERAY